MTNTRTPSATVRFYDMPDGTVMTEVDMHEGYKGTPAPVVDKNLAKQALKDGFTVPGCHLESDVRLAIK